MLLDGASGLLLPDRLRCASQDSCSPVRYEPRRLTARISFEEAVEVPPLEALEHHRRLGIVALHHIGLVDPDEVGAGEITIPDLQADPGVGSSAGPIDWRPPSRPARW